MLITDLLSAVTLSSSGNAIQPTKTTLSATTAAVKLHMQLTSPGNGTADGGDYRRSRVRVLAAVSPFSITAALAPYQMREQAVEVSLLPSVEANNPTFKESELIVAAGTYLYVWLEVPAFQNAPTFSLKLAEIN